MECTATAASQRMLQAVFRPRNNLRLNRNNHFIRQQQLTLCQSRIPSHQIRHASSSSTAPPPPPPDDKPIVLEKPDKFRPPSHGSRMRARSTTSMYGAGAAYNQGMSARERETSQKKSYPHMFPNEGTFMHWFLTTRWVHVSITMLVLMSLALWSALSTWSKTSPYAHLIPPINSLPLHPLDYFSELWSVYRLHLEYVTVQTAEKRRQNILDAQKRRLYRRAHGLEDLNADEVSGPDVRGLVEWDDGLTKPERERGGQFKPEMIGANMMAMGAKPGESLNEVMRRKRAEEEELQRRREEAKVRKQEEDTQAEEERLVRIGAKGLGEERRRPKLWFGIW